MESPIVILVECSELSADERLALASQISDELEGDAIALIKGETIVLDELSGKSIDPSKVNAIAGNFTARRKDPEHYSVESVGDRIIVHRSTPVNASERKPRSQLPPNVKQCPFCAFVTQYDEEYTVHVRSHGVGVA